MLEAPLGWAIDAVSAQRRWDPAPADHATSLYDMLKNQILPLFYRQREADIFVRAHAIALNGSFFNAQRMLQQYALKGYLPLAHSGELG